jgi:hypothetical protein
VIAHKSRGAKSIADAGRRKPHQERPLQHQRERLNQRPRLGFFRPDQLRFGAIDGGVEAAIGPAAKADLLQQGVAGLRLLVQRAQDVEADDVARTLLDGVERRFSIDARQA